MDQDSILMGLIIFTLLCGLAVGFWQIYSVKRAGARNSHMAFARRDSVRTPPLGARKA